MNEALKKISVSGKVLDLGGGRIRSSYFQFLRLQNPHEIVSLDLLPHRNPDIIADVEKSLPISDTEYDHVLCFNLLEHLYHKKHLLNEVRRILKPAGTFIGYVPFLVKYHPDPHDYFRYTHEALTRLLSEAGFPNVSVKFIGRGPFTAAWSQIEFVLPRIIRWPVTYLAFVLDSLLLRFKPVFKNTYALGYVFTAQK